MSKVKNKAVIRSLAFREFRKSGKMNCIVIFSVILTCVMFAALASVGGALINGFQNESMRAVGAKSMAGFKFCMEEDYEKIRSDRSVTGVTYRIIVGSVINDELKDLNVELNHAGSDAEAKDSFCFPETGRLPESEDEIAVSTLMLDRLGLPYETGVKVPVVLNIDGEISEHEFTLCGFWKGDPVAPAQQAWVSRGFVNKNVPKPQTSFYDQLGKGKDSGIKYAGYMQVSFDFRSSLDIAGKTEKLAERLYGNKENAPYFGVNPAYQTSNADSDSVTGYLMFTLLIFAAGYLIIYNIFRINISVNIRSYGLLKTIGTTSKQIRHMVRTEALIYSLIGIPFGLGGGVLLGRALMKFITVTLNIGSADNYTVSSDILLPVCVTAAVFTFATVLISCSGPCRAAGNVSPIEALRYNETSINIKKEQKKTGKTTPLSLALSNLARNRKKGMVVVLSLSLSLIILNSVSVLLNTFSFEDQIRGEITGDFNVVRKVMHNSAESFSDELQKINPEILESLRNTEGISEMETVYGSEIFLELSGEAEKKMNALKEKYAASDQSGVFETIENHGAFGTLYGITDGLGKELVLSDGEFDEQKWKTGRYAIVTTGYLELRGTETDEDVLYRPGDTVTFTAKDHNTGKTEKREYEVMAVGSLPETLDKQSSFYFDSTVIIPETEYFGLTENRKALSVMINAGEGKYDEVSEKLNDIIAPEPGIYLKSIESLRAEYEDFTRMIKIVGGSLSAILGLIGILNFVNSTVTGIVSRKRELAVMNAVGMTGKQLSSMLMWEGICYAVLTAAVSVLLGTPLCFLLVNFIAGESFSDSFTLTPVLVCVPVLIILSAVIPALAYRILCRESVVERLREN